MQRVVQCARVHKACAMDFLALKILRPKFFFLNLLPVLLVNVNPGQFAWQKIKKNFARLLPKRVGEVVKVATSHVLRFFSTYESKKTQRLTGAHCLTNPGSLQINNN